MDIDVVASPPTGVEADVLAFPVPDPVVLPPSGLEIDRLVEGRLAHLIEDGELKGSRGHLTLLHSDGRLKAHRVAAAGVGEQDETDADSLRTAAAAVARRASEIGARTVAWVLEENGLPVSASEQARAVVDGIALGPYYAGRWKTTQDDGEERTRELDRLILCGPGAEAVADDARRANVIARWTNKCRDLVNAPANELTPESLTEWAQSTASDLPTLRFESMNAEEIRAAGMGALTAVGQGSTNPPHLITIQYEPDGARDDFVLGLVGKAITFDAGGLSLKPADKLDEMKSDMGGGAAVLAATAAIAELGIPLRVMTVVPASENMPSGRAFRPGDIITSLNGKTIEVTNTDAEGRLILADALWHARQNGATHMVDLATLTGAMVVAMGDFYAGVFGNDEDWVEKVRAAGEAVGDHVWTWPLHETYRRHLHSTFADMKNSSEHRQGAPIYAARFLQEFVGDGPWAHLDIAGTAYLERGRGDYYASPGATGYGVRLLTELAQRLAGG
jgi:leucyl aminopeptidase